jgi:hypothetical protein
MNQIYQQNNQYFVSGNSTNSENIVQIKEKICIYIYILQRVAYITQISKFTLVSDLANVFIGQSHLHWQVHLCATSLSQFLPPLISVKCLLSFAGRACFCSSRSYTKNWLVQVQVQVTLRLTVSHSVSLGVEPHLGPMTRYLLLFGIYGLSHPLWREDGSAFCICCWPLPVQSFSGPSPLELRV